MPNDSLHCTSFLRHGIAASLFSLLPVVHAQAPTSPSTSEQIAEQVRSGSRAYDEKKFAESMQHYAKALDLGSDRSSVAYNAACSAALAGQPDLAFGFLDTAIGLGWIDAQHLQRDADLEPLHRDDRWEDAVTKAVNAEKSVKTRWASPAFETSFAENLSDADKAAGLARLWSEVKFNFVNFELVPDLDWDATFVEAMPRVLATESTFDYYQVLRRTVAKLNDGHTNVYLPTQLASMDRSPGLSTRLIENKVMVVRIDNRSVADAGLEVGMEITHVNGMGVKEYAAEHVAPFLCASTSQDRRSRLFGSYLLRGPQSEPITLTVRTEDGVVDDVEVERESRAAAGMRLFAKPRLEFEILEDNVGYLRLDTFANSTVAKQFARIFPKILQTDALIIDLRENGGGNSGIGRDIMTYFSREPFETTRWHTLQYRPAMRAWGRQPITRYSQGPQLYGKQRETTYDNPIALLIGPRTFSAAEDMAAVFDQLDRGKMIGEPTGGSTGQPLMFDLPGGGRARVCTKHDLYADGTRFVGVGIQPDVVVHQTIEDLRKGVDTVLRVALEQLRAEHK